MKKALVKITSWIGIVYGLCICTASATTYTVINANDAGTGSLRQAILSANADNSATSVSPHIISISGTYSINLASALPSINNPLIINASSINRLTINGFAGSSILTINSGKTVTLNFITFNGASSVSNGGGVNNSGTLTINNCTFQNNFASTGGAIRTISDLTCNNSTFTGNSSNNGSAIFSSLFCTVNLTNCIIQNNTGSGAAVNVTASGSIPTLNITNCIVRNNTNSGSTYGGGIYSQASTTITNTEISGNSGNRGAGICLGIGNSTTNKSQLTLLNCTVNGNTTNGGAAMGGGIYIQGTSSDFTANCSFTNCTISGNSAFGGTQNLGGGINYGGGGTSAWLSVGSFNNCTITGNSSLGNTNTSKGGGIEQANLTAGGGGAIVLNYCLVAGNNTNSSDNSRDINASAIGSVTGRNLYGGSFTWNYAGPVTTGNVSGNINIGSIINTSLTDNGAAVPLPNGGYVKTHALLANGSEAINPSVASSGLQATDQRGFTRDVYPDIGAYEYPIFNPIYSTTHTTYASDTSNNQNPTSVTTYNGSIYYIYTNPARQMVVGRIKPNGSVETNIVFDLEMGLDEKYHICPTIGVDKNGYIHLCGDMHNDSWKYFRSNNPEDITSWTRRYDLPGFSVTYPTIFYDKNREMYLLFRHRQDSTGIGNHRAGIIKYNAENSTFSMLGGISYTEKDGTTPTTKTMAWANGFGGNDCWYIKPAHRIYFDNNNRMHFIANVINVCLGTFSDTDVYSESLLKGGYESHTHILYAYSDDTGKTWRKADGSLISSLPLNVNNASVALDRTTQHDIIGGESELGAFNTNAPIISYQLYSDNSYHTIQWNGTAWVELAIPHNTNLFMCRPNGWAAWYNGTYIDYTSDGINWTSIAGTGNNFPGGLNGVGATGIDREYFKQTGHFRYEGSNNTFTSSGIYTINSNVGNTGNIAVSSVSLNNTSVSMNVGTATKLLATILPANASNQNLVWASSNNNIAYVDGNGLVYANGCGTATITVTTQDGNRTANGIIAVSGGGSVTGVVLNASSISISIGGSSQLVASLSPSNPCNTGITWVSSNTTVATVSSTGYVSGINLGTCTITATTADGAKTAITTVTVTSVAILNTNPEFDAGTTGYTWTQNGGTAGTFTVVTGAGLSAANAAKLTITNAGTNNNFLKLNSNYSLLPGNSYQVYFKAKADADRPMTIVFAASVSPFTWYKSYAVTLTTTPTVFGPFLFASAASNLPATLQFLVGGNATSAYLDSIAINDISNNTVKTVGVNTSVLSMLIGNTAQLSASIAPSTALNQTLIWTSDNPAVATVNNVGLLTASGNGSAIITAVTSDGGKLAVCNVTVAGCQWNGNINTDWNNNGNWLNGILPTTGGTILIPSGLANYPVLSNNFSIGKLTLQSGATINLNGKTCVLSDSIVGTGVFIGSGQSNLVVNGVGSLYFSQLSNGNSNTLHSLTINTVGTVIICNALGVDSVVKVAAGILVSAGNLTLLANSNGVARVPRLGGTITGNVTTQLYIPNKSVRKYSFIGSSVAQSINNAWQQQIYITGGGNGGAACGSSNGNGGATDRYNSNGFDKTQVNTPSMYVYNSIPINGTRWISIPNTNATNLIPGKGYRVNIRGDRNVGTCLNQLGSNAPTAPTSVTLNATGPLTQGNVTAVLTDTTQHLYTLLANPYPSPIGFSTFKASNSTINNKMWTYSPYGNGNYTTFANGIVTNPATGYNNTNADNLAIGQAFFVEANKTGTTVTFQESHKIDATPPNFQYFGTSNDQILRLGLYDTANAILDECVVRYNGAGSKQYIPEWDAVSFGGGNHGLASVKHGVSLAIATRALLQTRDTVTLNIKSNNVGVFEIQLRETTGFDAGVQYILKDNFLGKMQSIDLNRGYRFTTTNDTASLGANRLSLIIIRSATLPIFFKHVRAEKRGDRVVIDWEMADQDQDQVDYYEVEKQSESKNFVRIYAVNSTGKHVYSVQDTATTDGVNFYRIKAIGKTGTVVYSKTMRVDVNDRDIVIAPNPVSSQMRIICKGVNGITIMDMEGKTILYRSSVRRSDCTLNVSDWAKGVYLAQIELEGGRTERRLFVKQ